MFFFAISYSNIHRCNLLAPAWQPRAGIIDTLELFLTSRSTVQRPVWTAITYFRTIAMNDRLKSWNEPQLCVKVLCFDFFQGYCGSVWFFHRINISLNLSRSWLLRAKGEVNAWLLWWTYTLCGHLKGHGERGFAVAQCPSVIVEVIYIILKQVVPTVLPTDFPIFLFYSVLTSPIWVIPSLSVV